MMLAGFSSPCSGVDFDVALGRAGPGLPLQLSGPAGSSGMMIWPWDAAGRGHERRCEQERQVVVAEQAGVGREDRPGDAGHADGHQREHP